jgi:hypothetical protein
VRLRVSASNCLLLDGVCSDESWLGVCEDCGSGLSAYDVAEGLTFDGVDVDAFGGGDNAEAADLLEVCGALV